MREISGVIYKEVEIDRISSSGNAIAESEGGHMHVRKGVENDDEIRPGDEYLVRLKDGRSSHEIGITTGFGSFYDRAVEKFESCENEERPSPEPGEFFRGTISRVADSGHKVIEIKQKSEGVILVSDGEIGDEVEVRLTKKSGEDLIGRVIEFIDGKEPTHDLSESEKRYVENKFRSVNYESNMNGMINGNM